MVKFNPRIEALFKWIAVHKGKGRAYIVIAHKLARAVYHILISGSVFDEQKFLGTHYSSPADNRKPLIDGTTELTPHMHPEPVLR